MELKKGQIYKIHHTDFECGRVFKDFTAVSNCIIFSPLRDMVFKTAEETIHIDCEFLVTFDMELRFNNEPISGRILSTSFGRYCVFADLTKKDMCDLLSLFKERKKLNDFAQYLKSTKYRYNRKLDEIIKI